MKKKVVIIDSIVVLVILITGGIFAYLYFFTDNLKSNKEAFWKYKKKNEEIFDIPKSETLENYASKQKSSPYTSEGAIKTNATLEGTTDSDEANKIISSLQNCNITYTGKTDIPNGYIYRNIKANYTDMESLNSEFVKKDDVFAVKLDDAYDKFIGVENNNLKELQTKMESVEGEMYYSNQILSFIPNQIRTEDISSYFTLFTDEQFEQEKEKYLQIISDNLTDDMFSKQKSDNCTIYTLTLTGEQLSNIEDKILETIKNDEVLESALKNYMVNNLEMTEDEANNYISEFKQNASSEESPIQNKLQDLEKENENLQSVKLNVYVQKKKLLKSEIIIDEMDSSSNTSNTSVCTITKADNSVKLDFSSANGSSNNIVYSFYMQKIESSSDVKYDIIFSRNEEQLYEYTMEFSGLDGNQVEEKSELDLTYNSTKYVCTYTNNKTFGTNFTEDDVENNNIILLNTAPNSDAIQNLFTYISENFEKVNKEKMENAGIGEDQNPFEYYLPAIVPVGITELMSVSKDSKIITPTTLVLTMGLKSVDSLSNGLSSNSYDYGDSVTNNTEAVETNNTDNSEDIETTNGTENLDTNNTENSGMNEIVNPN